jgi:hypothetical protein
MRTVGHLGQLHASVAHRLKQIESTVDSLGHPVTFGKDRLAAFAIIELDNLWASFVRSYYLSWFRKAKTASGARISFTVAPPRNFDDAIVLASKLLYGKTKPGRTGRIEPAWHEKHVLVKLAKGCGTSVQGQIVTAMSISATVFDHLHSVRNFYAHRSLETANKLPRIARAFGLVPPRRASEIVLAVPPGRSATIVLDWLAEVRDTTDLLCT